MLTIPGEITKVREKQTSLRHISWGHLMTPPPEQVAGVGGEIGTSAATALNESKIDRV